MANTTRLHEVDNRIRRGGGSMSQITREDLLEYKKELTSAKSALAVKRDSDLNTAQTEIEKFAVEKRAEAEKAIDSFKKEKIETVNHSYETESIKIGGQIEAIDRLLEKAESLD